MLAIANTNDVEFDTLNLAKYNGTITAYNPKTGNHRTFKIATAQKGVLKGSRIVSLLSGPDNTSHYIGFGFVSDSGLVHCWKKYRRTQYEALSEFLNHAEFHAHTNGVEFKFSVRCRKCNRELTDPVSIDLGIGPVCRGEM